MQIKLEKYELDLAGRVGLQRRIEAISRGSRNVGGFNHERQDAWGCDIEAAMSELAVAKALGLYWDGSVNTYKSRPDVGNYEVRAIDKPHNSLIIRPGDADDRPFVLVYGKAPVFTLLGWMQAGDAKTDEYLSNKGATDRPPAWFVPQSHLWAIDQLPELRRRHAAVIRLPELGEAAA